MAADILAEVVANLRKADARPRPKPARLRADALVNEIGEDAARAVVRYLRTMDAAASLFADEIIEHTVNVPIPPSK